MVLTHLLSSLGQHRSLTQSRDDRAIRRLFNHYDFNNVGYLDEVVGKAFIQVWKIIFGNDIFKDVLTVSELIDDIPEDEVEETINLIFNELDVNDDQRLELEEFLKPSWGRVCVVLLD